MNRDQARRILWGLHIGAGDEKRRAAAIDAVLQLWVANERERDETSHARLPWPVRQAVSAVLHAGLEHADPKVREAREQLYNAVTHGRLTDPTLPTAEHEVRAQIRSSSELREALRRAEHERDELQELYEAEQGLRKLAERTLAEKVGQRGGIAERERQLVALRTAVKDVLDNDRDMLSNIAVTALERAYRWSETPTEGAARGAVAGAWIVRTERERDELLHAARAVLGKTDIQVGDDVLVALEKVVERIEKA